jgi:hypothetical protein
MHLKEISYPKMNNKKDMYSLLNKLYARRL